MNPSFNVIARYRTQDGRTGEVLEKLFALAAATRTEEGNLSYEFFRGVADDRQIVILERYRREEDFQAHRDSEHFREIGAGGIIPLLESRTISTFTLAD
ncbi:putative quinol monooxygenase [Arthrobacter ginkgonis]|uniref:Quinol monooxygenase n=1 Tax=Arthrobacter ginkgonis TaxID=1630594 RepID=A0ABP7CY57_9MICC